MPARPLSGGNNGSLKHTTLDGVTLSVTLSRWLNINYPFDVKDRYPNARPIADNRVIFNIKGNQYRLIVHVYYPARIVYIKFFGTHAEYDEIDATTVDDFSDI